MGADEGQLREGSGNWIEHPGHHAGRTNVLGARPAPRSAKELSRVEQNWHVARFSPFIEWIVVLAVVVLQGPDCLETAKPQIAKFVNYAWVIDPKANEAKANDQVRVLANQTRNGIMHRRVAGREHAQTLTAEGALNPEEVLELAVNWNLRARRIECGLRIVDVRIYESPVCHRRIPNYTPRVSRMHWRLKIASSFTERCASIPRPGSISTTNQPP